MNLAPIKTNIENYPAELHTFLSSAELYDSSGGYSDANVIFIDKDSGFFLKSAPKGALEREVTMTRYFHEKGLAANVLTYISDGYDWMLTDKVHGDDCTADKYLEQPERLCDIFAERLAILHAEDYSGCPIMNHTERYLAKAEHNKCAGTYDKSHFPDSWGYIRARTKHGRS